MRYFKILTGLTAAAVLAVALSVYLFPVANGAQSTVNTLGTDGVAIKGYDPVAYYTEGRPMKGKPEFTAHYKNAKWQFANAEHKALFEENPEKYEPAYGGYCAYGVASEYLVKIEPDAWAIRDGKLYLNYDSSVQRKWASNPDQYIKQADEKWPELIAKQ